MRVLPTRVLLLLLAWTGAAAATPLTDAYKKELVFLEAEKAALRKRLADVKAAGDAEAREARRALEALQRSVVAETVRAEQLSAQLAELERAPDGGNQTEAIEALAGQMSRAFETYGSEWAPPADPVARLADGFARALPIAAERSRVHRAPGAFFLADGHRVEGELIHIGAFATYGVSPVAAGALTPAGGGRLKLDPVRGEATARALAAGERPAALEVFLYDSLERAIEEKREKTPLEIVEAGGVVAWVIVGLGGFALLMALLRALGLAWATGAVGRLRRDLLPLVEGGRYDEAARQCRRRRGAVARVLAVVAAHLDRDRDAVEQMAAEQILAEEQRLDRFATAILVSASVAPLLGLLGTVTGMISTFDLITEFGTGDPKLLSGGISEALITTELGLVVAIPALLLGALLNGWADRLRGNVERTALWMVNLARLGRLDLAEEETPAPAAVPEPVAQAV